MPLAIDGLCLGTFHVLMVWLMIKGLDRACRGRTRSGGVLLGLAAWLKLLPLLGIAFLLLQRKTKAALIAILVAVGLDVVLSLAAFGPAMAWQEHAVWWDHGATGTTIRQLTSPWHEDEDRLTNQSVAITLRRLFSTLGSVPGSPRQHLTMAHLTGEQLEQLFAAITAMVVCAVVAFCWPAGRGRDHARTPAQIAMAILATLWLSPVMWSCHVTAATPALALILKRVWAGPRPHHGGRLAGLSVPAGDPRRPGRRRPALAERGGWRHAGNDRGPGVRPAPSPASGQRELKSLFPPRFSLPRTPRTMQRSTLLLAVVLVPLVAGRTSADGPAVKTLLDPHSANVEKRLKPTTAQVGVAVSRDPAAPGFVVTIRPGKAILSGRRHQAGSGGVGPLGLRPRRGPSGQYGHADRSISPCGSTMRAIGATIPGTPSRSTSSRASAAPSPSSSATPTATSPATR